MDSIGSEVHVGKAYDREASVPVRHASSAVSGTTCTLSGRVYEKLQTPHRTARKAGGLPPFPTTFFASLSRCGSTP